jgi:diadenosine tetraphosphatase ApaH/serine/threonine PP2A family protein phosphatase
MKIALISDVHANLEALESALRDIEKQGAETIHFLGDAVGYGPNPNECVARIDKYCDIKLLGNHDYAALGLESTETFNTAAKESLSWTQGKLKRKSTERLADFEMTSTYLDCFLVHASPEEPDQWQYLLTVENAARQFNHFSETNCFLGHSHLPTIYTLESDGTVSMRFAEKFTCLPEKRHIINVGSIGQPRDNDPRGCYLIYDTENREISYRRIEYDIEKAQKKMEKANLPEFLITRLAKGV